MQRGFEGIALSVKRMGTGVRKGKMFMRLNALSVGWELPECQINTTFLFIKLYCRTVGYNINLTNQI